MQIDFINNLNNRQHYFISMNNKVILNAYFDKGRTLKEIYTNDNLKVSQGFPYISHSLQLTPHYLIQTFDQKRNLEILIRRKSSLLGTCVFSVENTFYLIARHFGHKFSIFKNEKQIAYYQTAGIDLGSNHMRLIANNDINIPLFCSIALYLYSDFGNEYPDTNAPFYFGFQAKRFNKGWKPDDTIIANP